LGEASVLPYLGYKAADLFVCCFHSYEIIPRVISRPN
jgi:hypothetical protein